MPPQVPHYRPLPTPHVQFPTPSPSSPKSSRGNSRMRFPGKKLVPIILVLSALSIVRLVRIATSNSSPRPLFILFPSNQNNEDPSSARRAQKVSSTTNTLTSKEFLLLSNLVTQKAPCNLLVFGVQQQYLDLAGLNAGAGGTTLFLEDDPEKISEMKLKSNRTRVFKLEYESRAKKAYNLLKHAKSNPACAPTARPLQQAKCKLALRSLPPEVYQTEWDVVVVDGPCGDGLEAPGRMEVIYTAGLLARGGNETDVVVHDVDRTIEKWFSWEFLCEENLVAAKGRLWNFRITGESNSNSTRFCSDENVQII